MSITLQSNATGEWKNITTLTLQTSATLSLSVYNSATVPYVVMVWGAAAGSLAPSLAVDRQGKEVIERGWLECKASADTTWSALKFPETFPPTFLELAEVEGVLSFTVAANSRLALDFRLSPTDDPAPTTVGSLQCNVIVKGLPE